MAETKATVERYWASRPCGDGLADADRGTNEYFRQIELAKDELEPYVHDFAEFPRWKDRDVLEVGCGVGTDSVRFARAGARLTALDLTDTAVELTRSHLEGEGLSGDVRQADAESLPLPDRSFDLVWSWGVLHHTPNTARAVGEVARVLRPGGEARIMLYNRHSLFSYAVWLLRGAPRLRSLSAAVATVESPGTKAYTRGELRQLFEPFDDIEIRTIATAYDRRLAGPLAAAVPQLGWNHLIVARAS